MSAPVFRAPAGGARRVGGNAASPGIQSRRARSGVQEAHARSAGGRHGPARRLEPGGRVGENAADRGGLRGTVAAGAGLSTARASGPFAATNGPRPRGVPEAGRPGAGPLGQSRAVLRDRGAPDAADPGRAVSMSQDRPGRTRSPSRGSSSRICVLPSERVIDADEPVGDELFGLRRRQPEPSGHDLFHGCPRCDGPYAPGDLVRCERLRLSDT